MPIKTYKERSLQEAVARIKEEMGPEAMILSTRKIPKGLLDPYGVDLFEVRAQVKTKPKVSIKAPVRPKPQTGFHKTLSGINSKLHEGVGKFGKRQNEVPQTVNRSKILAEATADKQFDLSEELARFRDRSKSVKKQTSNKTGYSVLPESEPARTIPIRSRQVKPINSEPIDSEPIDSKPIDLKLMGSRAIPEQPRSEQLILDTLRPQRLNSEQRQSEKSVENRSTQYKQKQSVISVTPDFSEEQLESIHNDLISIKEMLFLSNQKQGIPAVLQEHPECINVYINLIRSGVSEQRVQMFLKSGWDINEDKKWEGKKGEDKKDSEQKNSSKKVTKYVINEILSNIEVCNPFDSNTEKKAQIAAFVGPTGVGKTTTIAKLAAELSMKQRKTVGLISIDSYRIGALEQLKTYSSIMGLPCLPAFTCHDLQLALRKMEDLDIILIDTAGHSHLDESRMTELGKFIDGKRSISTHLVLSATIDALNMKEAVDNFAVLNPKSYLFTKIDETNRCGVIIDQIINRKMPISFITNGQKVPEDIILATKKNILNLILK